MTKFSNKLKKPCFWPILGPFSQFLGQKKISLENLALLCTTSYGFLAPCQNIEKVNDTIQTKCPNRQKDGWKDRMDRPYFILPFRLLPGVQKANNWFFIIPVGWQIKMVLDLWISLLNHAKCFLIFLSMIIPIRWPSFMTK